MLHAIKRTGVKTLFDDNKGNNRTIGSPLLPHQTITPSSR